MNKLTNKIAATSWSCSTSWVGLADHGWLQQPLKSHHLKTVMATTVLKNRSLVLHQTDAVHCVLAVLGFHRWLEVLIDAIDQTMDTFVHQDSTAAKEVADGFHDQP